MARPRLLDMMQNYPFWLFDASMPRPAPVFTPTFGFTSITSPQLDIEIREIPVGNWYFPRKVIKRGSVAPLLTLARGCRFNDSDMWLWAQNALRGREPVRRNLVLVQFLGMRLVPGVDTGNAAIDAAARIPGRAWILANCLPGRYKASSDFDAKNSEVSIQELDVHPEYFQEITTATVSTLTGGVGAGVSAAASAGFTFLSVL